MCKCRLPLQGYSSPVRVPRKLSSEQIFLVKRRVATNYIATSTTTGGVPTLGQITFKLGDLPSFGELNALFAQYRIKKVDMMCVPRPFFDTNLSSFPISGTGPGIVSNFHYAIDKTGPGTPPSTAQIMQYANGKTHPVWNDNKPWHISLQPQTGAAQLCRQWLQTVTSYIAQLSVRPTSLSLQ